MSKRNPIGNSQRGVTLLENMIALIILSVGLLGLAGLQAYTLRTSSTSVYRQLAVQQAQDIVDRIRTNQSAIYENPDNTVQYLNITPDDIPATVPDCVSNSCSATQMALFDEWQWQTANHKLLPGDPAFAGGYVVGQPLQNLGGMQQFLFSGSTGNGPARMRYTITLRWDGDRTGATGLNCDPATATSADLRCYTLVIDL